MNAAPLLRIIRNYIDYDALLENEPSITRYEINRLFESVSKLLSNSPSCKSNELYNDLHLYIDGSDDRQIQGTERKINGIAEKSS